jgi:hypothetical protein
LLEVGQVVAHLDRPHTTGRHEYAQLAQLIADTDLIVF